MAAPKTLPTLHCYLSHGNMLAGTGYYVNHVAGRGRVRCGKLRQGRFWQGEEALLYYCVKISGAWPGEVGPGAARSGDVRQGEVTIQRSKHPESGACSQLLKRLLGNLLI